MALADLLYRITIAEAQDLKKRTEDAIKLALLEFERETGLEIYDLVIERKHHALRPARPFVTEVRLQVRLPSA